MFVYYVFVCNTIKGITIGDIGFFFFGGGARLDISEGINSVFVVPSLLNYGR